MSADPDWWEVVHGQDCDYGIGSGARNCRPEQPCILHQRDDLRAQLAAAQGREAEAARQWKAVARSLVEARMMVVEQHDARGRQKQDIFREAQKALEEDDCPKCRGYGTHPWVEVAAPPCPDCAGTGSKAAKGGSHGAR